MKERISDDQLNPTTTQPPSVVATWAVFGITQMADPLEALGS